MRAAVAGAKGTGLRMLAVTVLTSYDDMDLLEAGYRFGVVETVRKRAEQAQALGVDGLVASAGEAPVVRAAVGKGMILVTPGIRPAGVAAGDQKRVATPLSAIRDGADFLVVGRPDHGGGGPAKRGVGDCRGDRGGDNPDAASVAHARNKAKPAGAPAPSDRRKRPCQ